MLEAMQDVRGGSGQTPSPPVGAGRQGGVWTPSPPVGAGRHTSGGGLANPSPPRRVYLFGPPGSKRPAPPHAARARTVPAAAAGSSLDARDVLWSERLGAQGPR